MSAHYTPLPDSSKPDSDTDELEDAFASDNDDDDHESTPLNKVARANHPPTPHTQELPINRSVPGAYDFERLDYDVPPPGSPPGPSAHALPNNFGNTNGQAGSVPSRPFPSRTSFFRRAVGALLPSHYVRVPTESEHGPAVGGGTGNDGVFSNMTARPTRNVAVTGENGSIHMVPEDSQQEQPPSYLIAQMDTAPTYWEATATVTGPDPHADMIVENLPTGSVFIFLINIAISFLFQFVGFLMTYLMHTSHAAKYGSQFGLGLTLIQYGSYSRTAAEEKPLDDVTFFNGNETLTGWPAQMGGIGSSLNGTSPTPEEYAQLRESWMGTAEWMSFLMMTLGWFLVLTSLLGFWRVKRWERSIRASAPPTPAPAPTEMSQEEVRRAVAIRRMLFAPFRAAEPTEVRSEVPDEALNEGERLQRNLRRPGLL